MAITIDWGTKVINVPNADMALLQASPEVRGLDVDWFRLELKDLEDSEDGMAFPDTHRHNTEISISGLVFARTVEIINGYTVEFEDGNYLVLCTEANHNIYDVMVQNNVSINPNLSAGLIVRESGVSGLTGDESTQLDELHKVHGMKEGEDLVVTPDGRVIGDGVEISQTVVKVGDEVTVSRDP